MKKTIRLTEGDLHRIVKESVKRVLKEEAGVDEFSLAMDKIFTLVKGNCGDDSIRDTIAGWFWGDWDGASKIVPCEYDEHGMYELLYDLCNYDYITVGEDGLVDVEASNHKDIASIIKPYIKPEMGQRIIENLYGRSANNALNEASYLGKLVASNALNAYHNTMYELEEKGEKYSTLWWRAKFECDRIKKQYPSLA